MLAGKISVGALSSFVFYAVIVAGAVGALSEVAGDLQRAAGAAERLSELLVLKPEILSPVNPLAFDADTQDVIAFDGVKFSYPSRPDTSALKEISFNDCASERFRFT